MPNMATKRQMRRKMPTKIFFSGQDFLALILLCLGTRGLASPFSASLAFATRDTVSGNRRQKEKDGDVLEPVDRGKCRIIKVTIMTVSVRFASGR